MMILCNQEQGQISKWWNTVGLTELTEECMWTVRADVSDQRTVIRVVYWPLHPVDECKQRDDDSHSQAQVQVED